MKVMAMPVVCWMMVVVGMAVVAFKEVISVPELMGFAVRWWAGLR